MYCYMSLCNIPLLTSSLEPLHRFAPNFVWMFLWWTPTKFVKKRGATPIFNGIMGNFVQFLANFFKFFYKTTYQKSFIIGLESPQGVLFLVCSNKVALTYIYDF